MKKIIYMILFYCFVTGVHMPTSHAASVARDASITIQEVDLQDGQTMMLDGQWQFFKNELLTFEQVKQKMSNSTANLLTIPGDTDWERQFDQKEGFGTFVMRLQLPKELMGQTLGIHTIYQYGAYKIFIDEQEIMGAGKIGTSVDTHETIMSPQFGYFTPTSHEVYLIMHYSSFRHIRGGYINPIVLGRADVLNLTFNKAIITQIFQNGIIFIASIYSLIFAFYRKKEKLFLYFGLFCAVTAIRAFFVGPIYFTVLFPNVPWNWVTRIEYMLTELTAMLFILHIWQLYLKEFSKWVLFGCVALLMGLIGLTLVTEPIVFQTAFFNLYVTAAPVSVYLVYVLVKAIRRGSDVAKGNIFGIIIVSICSLNDFFLAKYLLDSIELVGYSISVYVIIHMLTLGKSYAREISKTERLNVELTVINASLDDKIKQRTMELQTVNEQLVQQVTKDGLTGIYNRHYFNDYLSSIFVESWDERQPLSILMLDLDEFKLYNDYYGHIGGDWLLKHFVEIISSCIPNDGKLTRYGGEEFSVILPGYSAEQAEHIAEHIRWSVENVQLEHLGRGKRHRHC